MFLWEEMTMSSIRKKIEYLEATKKQFAMPFWIKAEKIYRKVNGSWQEGKIVKKVRLWQI